MPRISGIKCFHEQPDCLSICVKADSVVSLYKEHMPIPTYMILFQGSYV